MIIELVTHGAIETLARQSLGEFLEVDCGLPPDDGYEYVRFAKGATAEEATTYKFSRCREGIKLAKRLGKRTPGELAKAPIEYLDKQGEKQQVSFTPKTPVSKLKEALAGLPEEASAPVEPAPSKEEARRFRAMQSAIDAYCEKHADARGLGWKVTYYAGLARVQHRALVTGAELVLAGRLLLELGKL